MWRTKSKFMVNQDSDQSISEEEGLDDNVLEDDCISLGGPTEKKEQVQLLSQLEILRDAHEHTTRPTIISRKDNQGNFFCLPRRASCTSDEELISDDEVKENKMLQFHSQKANFPGFGIIRKDEEWCEAAREVDALVHLNENAASSSSHAVFSKVSRSCKGARGKTKPKFSFLFQSLKEDVPWAGNATHLPSKAMSLLENFESTEHRNVKQSMSDLLESFQGEKVEQSNIHEAHDDVAVEQDYTMHSVAEPLDCFDENKDLLRGNSKVFTRRKGSRLQLVTKRSIYLSGNWNVDDDELPDELDSEPSSDDEEDRQNLKLVIPESKRKTMADQFQEAFGAASTRDEGILFALPKQSDTGLFRKLQHVMQNEKEREMDFIKSLQAQTSLKESYFDVKILSRCLEAKLTVCSCSFIQHEESSQWVNNHPIERKIGETSTIIFSSRSSSNVELEVGQLIRVHPPWKEVRVMAKDEIVILSTYFSQISS